MVESRHVLNLPGITIFIYLFGFLITQKRQRERDAYTHLGQPGRNSQRYVFRMTKDALEGCCSIC